MSQPIDEIDVILGQHHIIKILLILGHVETEAELLLLVARSSLDPQAAEIEPGEKSGAPERSGLGDDKEVYVRILMERIKRHGVAYI